jgi:deoxyribonuclease V
MDWPFPRVEEYLIQTVGRCMKPMHSWDLTPKQAVQLQKRLGPRIRTDLPLPDPGRIGGVDVGYSRSLGLSVATVVVLAFPSLELVESAVATTPTPFPYVPGLLSFRELPPILEALDRLSAAPEMILVDGHGRAHPRRFGIACHLGLWLRIPTIGVGKTRLCGEYEEPGLTKGSASPLRDGSETLGVVLRTRTRVRPVFVSVGYGLPLEACVNWTLAVTPRYRIPEPVRQAHNLAARQTGNRPC